MKHLAIAFLFLFPLSLNAQSSFYDRNNDDYSQLERMDILKGQVTQDFHTSNGSISRKEAVAFLENYIRFLEEEDYEKNTRDIQEIKAILDKNSQWATDSETGESDYSLFDLFYQKRAEFFSIKHKDFFVAINPILNYQQMLEFGNTDQNLFQNRKGIEVRANIKDRIGLYTTITDNQERGPLHHQRYIGMNQAIPNGPTFYKDFKPEKAGRAQDYILANGYLDAELIENTLNVSFGHNRFHLGDGYRSMFLSDMGSNYLFFKINTTFWKINYQNLFMELTPQFNRGADVLLPKKYAAMHHLSMNLTKWLNIGLFEAVVFGRQDHFEFQYLNPVILYRYVEQSIGSPDNALLGFNFKVNPNIKAVFYGQFLLDEFKFDEITSGNGWWANKFATQVGTKIADPFGVNNLMVQVEHNRIRPFMYSYQNGTADYSHNNQSLAHPYGANLSEIVLNIHYKPHKKIHFNLESFYNKQGRDNTDSISYGGDIFKLNSMRNSEYGINMFNGFVSDVLYTNLNASYEVRPNLYFDLGGGFRMEEGSSNVNPTDNSAFIYGGLRWNTARRRYNY